MKTTWLEKTLAALLAVVFGLIVLHAPLSVGLGVLLPDYELLIKSWKEILMIVAIPLAVVITIRNGLWRGFVRDPIFYGIAGFAVLVLVTVAVFYQGAAATAAGLAIDLRYLLFFGLVYIVIKAVPGYRRLMVQIGVAGACIVVGFATLQLFLPADILTHIGYGKDTIVPYMTVDENHDFIRVNSTLRGPNPLGAYAGMVLALVAAAWARGKLHTAKRMVGGGALAACAAVALWISYSRSSLVAGVIGVLIVAAVAIRRKVSRTTWIVAAVVIFAIGGTLMALRGSDLVSNVLLHDNPTSGGVVSSNDQHEQSLVYGIDVLMQHPFGVGIGSTGSASLHGDTPTIIENQYLFVGHETGWLGLLLFIALFTTVLVRLWCGRRDWLSLGVFASGIALGLIGLLLPVWADDTVAIVWWGLTAIAIAGGHNERKKFTK